MGRGQCELHPANVFDPAGPDYLGEEVEARNVVPPRPDVFPNGERFVPRGDGPELVITGILEGRVGRAGADGDVVVVNMGAGDVGFDDEPAIDASGGEAGGTGE